MTQQIPWSSKARIFLSTLPAEQTRRLRRIFTDPKNVQNAGLWISAIVAGFVAVGYAIMFRKADELFHQSLNSFGPYFSFVFTPGMFLLSWFLVQRFSPEAAGSGIPQIIAANEMEYSGEQKEQVDRLLSLRTAGVKILSSLLCVLGGGAIGREGPTLQISTSVFHFFGKRVRQVVPQLNEQTWVVAGAAAGLAAAFNTPLGGIVYAIEEMGGTHFHRIRTALISGVIVSGLVAQWLLGSYLYLGFPHLQSVGFGFLPVAIFTGFITGYMGGAFSSLLFYFLKMRQKIKSLGKLALVTVGCGLVMACLIAITPKAAGTGIETITDFLFKGEIANPILILTRFLGTMVSYLSGAAGGIFSPSLTIGATMGSWLANVFHTEHPNLMVLLGMIGFLTGVTRTPFTAFILVLEMTDKHVVIFPMMIAAIVAQWAAHLINPHSFYELVKEKWIVK